MSNEQPSSFLCHTAQRRTTDRQTETAVSARTPEPHACPSRASPIREGESVSCMLCASLPFPVRLESADRTPVSCALRRGSTNWRGSTDGAGGLPLRNPPSCCHPCAVLLSPCLSACAVLLCCCVLSKPGRCVRHSAPVPAECAWSKRRTRQETNDAPTSLLPPSLPPPSPLSLSLCVPLDQSGLLTLEFSSPRVRDAEASGAQGRRPRCVAC
jgi:hypothetical protein